MSGRNGADGAPGKDGRDGIPGKDGNPGKNGKDGKDGRYILAILRLFKVLSLEKAFYFKTFIWAYKQTSDSICVAKSEWGPKANGPIRLICWLCSFT